MTPCRQCKTNPATTTLRAMGREWPVCNTCEPLVQADINKVNATLRESLDQVHIDLAARFGNTPQVKRITELIGAQLNAGISVGDVVGNVRQAVNLAVVADAESRVRAQSGQGASIPLHGPAPSADHPHPAAWACDHLCRPAPPASPPAPPPTPPSEPQSADQSAAGRPRTSPERKAVNRRKLHAGHKFLIGTVAWLTCAITGMVLAAHHNHGGFALIILAVLTLFAAIVAGIGAIIADGVDQHERWISQFPPEQQAAIRKAERAAAWGLTAAAAVALHESNKRMGEKLSASAIGTGPPPGKAGAAMWQAKQRRRAEAESQQQRQELLDAIRRSSQPAPDPTATALGRSQLSEAGQRRRRELGW